MNRIHKISDTLRIRLGDWGIFKSVFILEEKRKVLFFNRWVSIDFTVPKIHSSIEEAASFLIRQNKNRLYKGDINNFYQK